MLSYPSVVSIAASCDWLTLTFKEGYVRKYVSEDAHELLAKYTREGAEGETWAWMGFEGWSIAGVSWGTREDCDILRLSGGMAELLFSRFCHHPCNCSRLDVALTVSFGKPIHHVASLSYQAIELMAEPTIQRVNSLIVNTRGGETLYIGSRSSDQFGRVYDKGVESGRKEMGLEWRYEVEFKSERAGQVLKRLTSTKDRPTLYVALVATFFEKRGVGMPSIQRGMDIEVPLPVVAVSDDRAVAWLAKQVRPTVHRLLQKGKGPEVLIALGLGKDYLDASD